MDELRDRFAALDRMPVPHLWSEIDRRVTDAAAVKPAHGQVTWRAERAPHRLSPMLILLLLSLLLALALGLVTVGSRLPNLWTSVVPSPTISVPTASVVPSPTPSAPTQRMAVGPAPAGPPQPGGIAHVTSGPQRGIVLVDPSAGAARPLTPPLIEMLDRNGCARETDLDVQQSAFVDQMTWSPDGRALAFQLAVGQVNRSEPRPSCGLFVVSSDGQTLERVLPAPDWETPLDYSPAWAPDGSHIAVALEQSVALVPLDGSDLLDLGRPCDGCQPAVFDAIGGWSPDGSLIAAQFVDDDCCADDTAHYIAVANVVTAEWTLLWSGTSQEAPGEPSDFGLLGWLHDGRVAAFSKEGIFAAQTDVPGGWTQLPFRGPFVDPDGHWQLGLWSPDQSRAALGDSTDGVRVRHLTTGRIDKIVDWILAHPLVWSPDGGQLVVVRGSARELWLIEADGGNPRRLASGTGDRFSSVAWQPVWPGEENER